MNQLCQAPRMNCIAFAVPGRSFCVCHARDKNLRPTELSEAEKTAYRELSITPFAPPTPWDDDFARQNA